MLDVPPYYKRFMQIGNALKEQVGLIAENPYAGKTIEELRSLLVQADSWIATHPHSPNLSLARKKRANIDNALSYLELKNGAEALF